MPVVPRGTDCWCKERRDSPAQREPSCVGPLTPPIIPWQIPVPEDQGIQPSCPARPSTSSLTCSQISPLGSEPPRTDSVIGTTFFSLSSSTTVLGSPSFPFWEMRTGQNAMQTPRWGSLLRGPIRKAAQLLCQRSSESPESMRISCSMAWPLHLHSQDPPPKGCSCSPIPVHRNHPLSCELLWHLWSVLFLSHLLYTTLLHAGYFFFFFGLFRAACMAYGSFQARDQIGAAATSLRQSHSNMGSEPHLQPTPQLMARQDP